MRIASLHMTNRYLKQLNRTFEEKTRLMEQSDGDRIHRPSDDAVGYSKFLRYSGSLTENTQYQTNVKTAVSWMKNSDAALADMTKCFSTIVEKSNAAQGTNTLSDMKAIAGEMKVMVQQAVADANTQVDGRYLFSGQSDLVKPYTMSTKLFDRGLAKTLDDKQTSFFNSGTGDSVTSSSGGISQMLAMKGSDNNTYYLNTKTGKIYSKEFMDKGYADTIAAGQTTVQAGDEVGTLAGWSGATPTETVSKYFDSQGVIKTPVTSPGSVMVNGQTVNLNFETIKQNIVTYQGDRKNFSMVKENGAEQPASDEVNANGVDIMGTSIFDDPSSGNESSGAAAFNDLLTVVAKTEQGDSAWESSDGKTLANNAFNIVNNAESKLAARQQVYTSCQDMLTTMNQSITSDITDVHSADVAKLAVELMQAQTVYNLSLSVGSRILPPTLADYL